MMESQNPSTPDDKKGKNGKKGKKRRRKMWSPRYVVSAAERRNTAKLSL